MAFKLFGLSSKSINYGDGTYKGLVSVKEGFWGELDKVLNGMKPGATAAKAKVDESITAGSIADLGIDNASSIRTEKKDLLDTEYPALSTDTFVNAVEAVLTANVSINVYKKSDSGITTNVRVKTFDYSDAGALPIIPGKNTRHSLEESDPWKPHSATEYESPLNFWFLFFRTILKSKMGDWEKIEKMKKLKAELDQNRFL